VTFIELNYTCMYIQCQYINGDPVENSSVKTNQHSELQYPVANAPGVSRAEPAAGGRGDASTGRRAAREQRISWTRLIG